MTLYQRTRKQPDGTASTDPTWTLRFTDPLTHTRRTIALGASTRAAAERVAKQLLVELKTTRIPRLLEQLRNRHALTFSQLFTDYTAAHCPDRHNTPRSGPALANTMRDIHNLATWWGPKNPNHISQADCADYHTHRTTTIARATTARRGPGHRTVDIELTTLSNLLNWAVDHRRIEANPIAHGRRRFTRAQDIIHCRDHMPASASELHQLARSLFANPRSATLGAQLLLEAYTGCRTSEILRLRWDATRTGTSATPGYSDGKYLYIERSKHGINPFILLHPALTDFLAVWKQHCQHHHPDNPWILPATGKFRLVPVDKTSLTHALAKHTKTLNLPHRTSHGLRAYYVTVRRAQGISDAQISIELGQKSGAALIVQVYGAVPPNWIGGPELTWLPPAPEQPAWTTLLPANSPTNILAL